MKINSKLAEFLFLNMFAHDPYHDFSKGAADRLGKLIGRLTSLNWLVSGGDGNAQSGGDITDLDTETTVAGRDTIDDDSEIMGLYSEFGYNATIWNILKLTEPGVPETLASWITESNQTQFGVAVAEMASKIRQFLPKDNDIDIPVECTVEINQQPERITRSVSAKRRKFINQVQEIVDCVAELRVIIVANTGTPDTDTVKAETKRAGGFLSGWFGKGGDAIVLPPPALASPVEFNKLYAKMPNSLALAKPPVTEPLQVNAPLPPTRIAYANMYYSLANLYNTYEEEQKSIVSNGESDENFKALDEMKNVIQFYGYAFEYYIAHIENMSSSYSINNSDFITDALFYYFIDLCANRTNSDPSTQSKLMSDDDASYRNSVFEIIYMLRKPVKKDMDGGAIGNIMTGGTPEQYNAMFNRFNAIPPAVCNKLADNYSIAFAAEGDETPLPTIPFDPTNADSIDAALTGLNVNVKAHLLGAARAILREDMAGELLAAIEESIDRALDTNPISVWNKQFVNQLRRFMGKAGTRTGIQSITAQLTGLYVHCKGEMLRLLQRHKTAIVKMGDESSSSTGSASAGNEVIGTFLQHLCKKMLDVAGVGASAAGRGVGSDILYNAQKEIIRTIANAKKVGDADAKLLQAFVDAHELTEDDMTKPLTKSCKVDTQYFINNPVLENTFKAGIQPMSRGKLVEVKLVNNALTTKIDDNTTRYVDKLTGITHSDKQGGFLNIENMCPVTCVLDAMGSFGSCMKGSSSDYYGNLRAPTQIFITDEVEGGFEFNMTTRHSAKKGTSNNGVVVVEYYIVYKGFTVSNCVIEATVKDSAVNILSANNTFAELLNYIEQNAPAGPDAQIKWEDFFDAHGENIVRIISRKMIGDFGQEMSAVYPKGGYINGDYAEWKITTGAIRNENPQRFILKTNGDRPSFVRESEILLAEPAVANQNTVIVYLGSPNGVVVMSNAVSKYFESVKDKKGGALQMKRKSQTKKRKTRNHRETRKISTRKTRRLRRNPL